MCPLSIFVRSVRVGLSALRACACTYTWGLVDPPIVRQGPRPVGQRIVHGLVDSHITRSEAE